MAFAQRSSLRSNRPVIARSRLRSVRLDIIRTLLRSDASASSNVPRICLGAIIACEFYLTLTPTPTLPLRLTRAFAFGAPGGRALPQCSLTKSASDIIFRLSLAWICENFRGRPKLDQLSKIKESGVIGDASSLLHIVRYRYDGVLAFELMDQFLDLGGGDRIKRRTGLIH